MISSQHVNQMAMQQQQQHMMLMGGQGMAPPMPAPGLSQYPAQFSFGLHHNPNQHFGARVGAGLIGGMSGVVNAASTVNMVAGLGSLIPGVAGLGGGAVGAMGSFGAAIPLMAGGAMMSAMAGGARRTGEINQIFGNMMYANPSARYGRGMSTSDLRSMYSAINNIADNDPFTTFEDGMQIANRFTQMGMHQGVQNADKLSKMVRDLGETLKTMARTMGTTIEEATEAFGSMRQAGFYTSADVMGNTTQMGVMRGFGMTSGQFGGMQQAAAGMARGMGMAGQTGARFTTNYAQDLMGAVKAGTISGERLMDITGAKDAVSAAAAFSQRNMGTMAGFMNRSGAGQALLAGLGSVDSSGRFTGGIDESIISRIQSGELDLNDMSRMAQGKMSSRGAQASFMQNREDITEGVLGNAEGAGAIINIIKNTLKEDEGYSESERELLFRQLTGQDRRSFRLMKDMADRHKETRERRLQDIRNEMTASSFGQEFRENATIGGITKRIMGTLDEAIVEPFKDAGQALSRGISQKFQDLGDIFYGVTRFSTTPGQMRSAIDEMTKISLATVDGNISAANRSLLAKSGIDQDAIMQYRSIDIQRSNNNPIMRANAYARMADPGRMMIALGQPPQISGGLKSRVASQIGQVHMAMDKKGQKSALDSVRESVRSELRRNKGSEPSKEEVDAAIGSVSETAASAVSRVRAFEDGDLEDYRTGTMKSVADELQALSTHATGDDGTIGLGAATIAGATTGAGIGAMLAAVPTFGFGAGVGAAVGGLIGGIGGAAAQFFGSSTEVEDQQRDFQEGKGVELMSKLSTGGKLREFDKIIKGVFSNQRIKEEDRFKVAAQRLKGRLGIDVTERDVEIANSLITGASGGQSAFQRLQSGDYSGAADLTKKVAVQQRRITAMKTMEAFQAFGTTATQGLGLDIDDELSKAIGKIGESSTGQQVFSRIQEAIDMASDNEAISSKRLGKDASASARLFVEGVEKHRSLKGLFSDGLSLAEITSVYGGTEESMRKLLTGSGIRLTGDRDDIVQDSEKVAKILAAQYVGGVAAEGMSGVNAHIAGGKTDLERQTEAVTKLTHMVDALYAHNSNQTTGLTEGARQFLDSRGRLVRPDR